MPTTSSEIIRITITSRLGSSADTEFIYKSIVIQRSCLQAMSENFTRILREFDFILQRRVYSDNFHRKSFHPNAKVR